MDEELAGEKLKHWERMVVESQKEAGNNVKKGWVRELAREELSDWEQMIVESG